SAQSWGPRVAFSPDGRFLLTSDSTTARLWDAPAPLPDEVPRLSAWVEAATGLALDERGGVRVLDRDAWLAPPPPLAAPRRARRRRARAPRLDRPPPGGAPAGGGAPRGARALGAGAEPAHAEPARARPRNPSVRDALARLHARLGRLDRAAAELAEASRWIPDDAHLPRRRVLLLLESGDRAGWRDGCAPLLARFGGANGPRGGGQRARARAR